MCNLDNRLVVSNQLIRESLLQGLRCLLHDVQQVAPDHVSVVSSMIRDFEDKVNMGQHSDRYGSARILDYCICNMKFDRMFAYQRCFVFILRSK